MANGTSVFSGGSATAAKVTLGASATIDDYLVAAAAGDGSANSITSWFQFEGNTYLVNDNTAGAFSDGNDTIVKITGLVDLSTSSYTAADIITIA